MNDTENTSRTAVWKWVSGIAAAVVTALLTATLAFMTNVASDATVSLQNNLSQDQELTHLRTEISSLRAELRTRTDGNYTALEATRDLAYVERRLAQIERQIEMHMQKADAHHSERGN